MRRCMPSRYMTQKTYTMLNDELSRELSDGAFSGLSALEASTTERRLALIQREFRQGQDSMAKQIDAVKAEVRLLFVSCLVLLVVARSFFRDFHHLLH